MALLEAEAAKLDLTMLQRGIVEEIITVGDLFRVLNFVAVDGLSYTYSRESGIGAAQWTEINGTTTGNDATYANVVENLRRVTDFADIDKQLEATHSNINSQRAEASRLVAKRIGRKIEDAVINGTGTAPQPSGLKTLTASLTNQTKYANNGATNGGKILLKDIDLALDTITAGMPDAYICNGSTIVTMLEILRAMNAAEYITLPGRTKPTLAYRGIPFIRNDWIASDETRGSNTDCTSLYIVSFDEALGFHGIIPRTGAGMSMEEQTWVQGKDARRIFGRSIVGFALKSTKSVARIQGIRN